MHECTNKHRSWVAGGLGSVGAVLVSVGLILAPHVAEAQVPLARSFERFEFDSGSVEGVWVELRSAYAQFDRSDRLSSSADVVGVEGLLAYGGDGWELGLRLPYVNGTAGTSIRKSSERINLFARLSIRRPAKPTAF